MLLGHYTPSILAAHPTPCRVATNSRDPFVPGSTLERLRMRVPQAFCAGRGPCRQRPSSMAAIIVRPKLRWNFHAQPPLMARSWASK